MCPELALFVYLPVFIVFVFQYLRCLYSFAFSLCVRAVRPSTNSFPEFLEVYEKRKNGQTKANLLTQTHKRTHTHTHVSVIVY